MTKRLHILALLIVFLGGSISAQQDTVKLYLRPNVTKESIQLRWTAGSPSAWYFTNKNGVVIERYTMMRDDAILDTPRIVTDSKIYSSWGRYDLNGAENAMYFSKTLNGNMTELVPHYGEWTNYSTYQFQNVEFNNLLDLTDNAVRNQLRINFDQITTITPSKVEMYEIPNNIAKWAREQGYNGIIAPGARGSKNYENIIIFEQSYIDKTLNTPIRIK